MRVSAKEEVEQFARVTRKIEETYATIVKIRKRFDHACAVENCLSNPQPEVPDRHVGSVAE